MGAEVEREWWRQRSRGSGGGRGGEGVVEAEVEREWWRQRWRGSGGGRGGEGVVEALRVLAARADRLRAERAQRGDHAEAGGHRDEVEVRAGEHHRVELLREPRITQWLPADDREAAGDREVLEGVAEGCGRDDGGEDAQRLAEEGAARRPRVTCVAHGRASGGAEPNETE
ncbi:hypothetical protein AB1Y20_023382 [Prymnesium parvum]|uniref:Uncharacterized protein n=1 Tax=Prymnesium parvum TaxID=97485 RepID=A0AB34JG22_PRYPA